MIELIGLLSGIIGLIAAAYSAWNWFRYRCDQKRLAEPIKIHLVDTETGVLRYALPYEPPRRTITRAEVQGLLGMIPSKQTRYELVYLIDPKFMHLLQATFQGNQLTLEIKVTEDELKQFDLSQAN